MLSPGAWNALLKTLEEPPPHVKFIFATTEVHKGPADDPVARAAVRLPADPDGEDPRARRLHPQAGGLPLRRRGRRPHRPRGRRLAPRRAFSLLDRVIAGVQGELTGAAAARLLGVADRRCSTRRLRAILRGDAATAAPLVRRDRDGGLRPAQRRQGMLSVLRDLVVARAVSDPGDLLDLADEGARRG